jgi:predicted nucleic acid-binding protein
VIVIADTSGIIAASDRAAQESVECQKAMREAGTVVVSALVLAEVDHTAKARFGPASRTAIFDFIGEQLGRQRFEIPHASLEILDTARLVHRRYRGLDLDLADCVNVALAAAFRTDTMLTLDHGTFRAVRPLTPHKRFRLLPEDL